MGGKALNRFGVFTEKKSTEEFQKIGAQLSYQVAANLGIDSEVVTCYRTKADHGDLDLLLKIKSDMNINYADYIKKTFKPQAINSNGGVYSFDYKNFQVDFIPIPEDKWETAKVYFSYDPLGNIMGKTYHKFGLSYGWEGLFYKYRNFNGRNSKDILLTNNIKKIFEFGGYDYNRYLFGFNTLEDIFKFCINSKYFDTEMFQMENLKSIDKKRNRKRSSYHIFLKFLKDNEINTSYVFKKDKKEYLKDINDAFPEANLGQKIFDLDAENVMNQLLAEKFNGDIIMKWLPELKGKDLTMAISKFKKALGCEYERFISNEPIEEIKNLFLEIYKN